MNPSQALSRFVSRSTLSRIFNNEQLINLRTISNPLTAQNKLQGDPRPSYDPALYALSSSGLLSKSLDRNVLDRNIAEQLARTIDVTRGNLPVQYEYDSNITFETRELGGKEYTLINNVRFEEIFQVLSLVWVIDVYYNDHTPENPKVNHLTTYHLPLNIPNEYYGLSNFDPLDYTEYEANNYVTNIERQKQLSEVQVSEGDYAGSIQLSGFTPELRDAIQTDRHIGGIINMRVVFVRNGEILFGPLKSGRFKINGATMTVDPKNEGVTINLELIKTWEQITQRSGIRTSDSYLKSKFNNDGFFKNASNAQYSKTFKEV